MYEQIVEQARDMISEFIAEARLERGQILVVGCSSSEIVGERIGKGSDINAARAVFEGIYPILQAKGIYLAAQCCEHLNRALIIESECAEKYGYDEVSVRPVAKAGGSFATAAYESFSSPVAVEKIRAHAGIDIGGTLVGMHLREVAVPVRISPNKLGEARVIFAKTRPKYIGGARAVYPE